MQDAMTADERSERASIAFTMLDLMRQLKPSLDVLEVNPEVIAFADIALLREWTTTAKSAIDKRKAAADPEQVGAKRKERV